MRITILTQYYFPEIGAPQVRLAALASNLRELGHGVQVVTAMPNYPKGLLYPGYQGKWFLREKINGIDVARTWLYPASGRGAAKRLLNYFTFTFSSILALALVPRADILFVESPPIFLCLSAWLVALLRRQRLCINISDLWPDSVVELGIMKEGALVRAARVLEHWLYDRAWKVCGVTYGILDKLAKEKGVGRSKLIFLPNGVDLDLFAPQATDLQLKSQLALNGQHIFLYAGTHGYAQGLDVIIRAADRLRCRKDISFLFVGDGPEKDRLQALVQGRQLHNVLFMDPHPISDMPRIFSLATASIVPLRKVSLFEGARPSKIFPSLACGKPVIYSGTGEAAALINQEQCGLLCPPEDAFALSEAVVYLSENPQQVELMGQNGRSLVQREYGWRSIILRWLQDLEVG